MQSNPISSARAATDTRHRIKAANSQRRRIKLIGVGSGGGDIVQRIGSATVHDVQAIVANASGDPLGELAGAEMIFLVACSGDDVSLAPRVKQVAREANVMITGILVQSASANATAQPELALLRDASDMLILASDPSYVLDMLVQLGA